MNEHTSVRGTVWFRAFTGQASPMPGDPKSVLTADAPLGDDNARFLCVVPDPHARFPCARHGEVGLEEGYTLATRVRETIEQDKNTVKRPIIAIVDSKNLKSSRRRSLPCPTTFAITRSLASSTNCFTSRIQRSHHSRRFGTSSANWSQPSQMPALAPSIFTVDLNRKERSKCERLPSWYAPRWKRSGWKSRLSKMIQVLANALVPIFVGLLFGYAAGLRKVVDNKDVRSLISFLMTFALPCSLFVTIARTPRLLLWGQAKGAVVLTIVYAVVFVATYYASRNLGKNTAANSAVLALTLGFPNLAGVGFPLLLAVYGPQASVTVAVGLAVGAITITPITLAILESGTSAGRRLSPAARIRVSLWRALKKPVFWAPVLGVVAAVVELHMPTYLDRSLTIVGDSTEGTALFVTGLIVSAQRFSWNWGGGG